MIFYALLTAISAVAGATVALIISYAVCRLVIDRRRLAAWESAWALTGPRWTSRR
jgi:membrane protein DedA with SNARE-associated domain